MSDDYLFDRSGASDPEVERLETLLARYRYAPQPLAAVEVQRARRVDTIQWAVAAAVLLIGGVLFIRSVFMIPDADSRSVRFYVDGVAGVESVRTGDTLKTGAEERARVEITSMGHVDVAPNSRVRIVASFEDKPELFLERGSVHAKILAQPRTFQIGTPAGRSIDLGCEYSLDVNARGESELRVTTGQVAFEFDGREIYVPAHARCTSAPHRGPSTPVLDSSSQAFHDALAAVEFDKNPSPSAIAKLLDAAEREDSLSLWHLFDSPKTAPALRDASYAKLAKGFPLPDGVDAKSVLGGDRVARERWLETMKPAWRTGGF